MTDVVALAAELLAIDSSTGSEGEAVEFVSRWLLARGWNVELQEVTKGRANVWATRKGKGVTLSTHLDTVPPFFPPREGDGQLYGRGACDAKGIAAAMLACLACSASVAQSTTDPDPNALSGWELVLGPTAYHWDKDDDHRNVVFAERLLLHPGSLQWVGPELGDRRAGGRTGRHRGAARGCRRCPPAAYGRT